MESSTCRHQRGVGGPLGRAPQRRLFLAVLAPWLPSPHRALRIPASPTSFRRVAEVSPLRPLPAQLRSCGDQNFRLMDDELPGGRLGAANARKVRPGRRLPVLRGGRCGGQRAEQVRSPPCVLSQGGKSLARVGLERSCRVAATESGRPAGESLEVGPPIRASERLDVRPLR